MKYSVKKYELSIIFIQNSFSSEISTYCFFRGLLLAKKKKSNNFNNLQIIDKGESKILIKY